MPRPKQEQDFGDEPDEAGLGLEVQHFFKRSSSEDHDSSDFGSPINEDGRLRMRPDIFLEGPQYTGIKSNRKAVFGEEETSDSEEDGKGGFPFKNQRERFDSDDNSEEEGHNIQGPQAVALDGEMEALNKEYMELQAQEEEMLRSLKRRGDEDVQKGQAVSHQKALWDRALEIRISLQKSFSNANHLPQGDVKSVFCNADTEAEKAFSRLTTSAVQTLGCLTDVLKALVDQNNTISEASPAIEIGSGAQHEDIEKMHLAGSSDLADREWKQIDSLYSRFIPFRNSSVDRWQRKTQLSTGAAATRSKLRAFNQSVSQQIETYMREPSRMVQRMQLNRSSVNILGMPARTVDGQRTDTIDGVTTEMHANNEAFDGDPELIDDSEFYQELLHEFLESSDPTALGSVNLYAVRKLRNKKRKVVDRRASKGRKIRYNVHDKIVNFMAPEPMNFPPMASKLFANLFGQHSQKKE